MNRVALKMLFGDTAKLLGLIFGMAFSTLLICQQASMFVGIMSRTANQISETREPDIWVMDPAVDYVIRCGRCAILSLHACGAFRGSPGPYPISVARP